MANALPHNQPGNYFSPLRYSALDSSFAILGRYRTPPHLGSPRPCVWQCRTYSVAIIIRQLAVWLRPPLVHCGSFATPRLTSARHRRTLAATSPCQQRHRRVAPMRQRRPAVVHCSSTSTGRLHQVVWLPYPSQREGDAPLNISCSQPAASQTLGICVLTLIFPNHGELLIILLFSVKHGQTTMVAYLNIACPGKVPKVLQPFCDICT